MLLSTGEKLGPYEILGLIGKGGMGEVYRGTDTRLGRPVAIKVSSRDFSDRFEREARAISSLNHPNICTLYDVGPNYLVMELVEGEMLSTMLRQGPLPLAAALGYAEQIMAALTAAHAKGVIHRDLKPGNIIVTSNGVKVLDFGLAKMSTPSPAGDSTGVTETMTEPITRPGSVMGTLNYMAPEQVEGKETGERSDIFSFGIVLYEMITGQRPFGGDTQASLAASILKDQPAPMSIAQPTTPRALDRLVGKCLEKKPEDRWRSAQDLKAALELIDPDAAQAAASSSGTSVRVSSGARRGWLKGAIVAVALLAISAAAWWLWPKPAPVRASRFQVTLPENVTFSEYVSLSPDGRKLVFNATGEQTGLWIHDLDTLEWRKLEGTEGAVSPFWSPDSRFLGFGAGNELKKIEVASGTPQTLCEISQPVGTGSWNRDGVIIFGPYKVAGPIRRVSSAGGIAAEMTKPDQAAPWHFLPQFLPDGKHFLYLRVLGQKNGIYAGSLDSRPEEQPTQRILETTFAATYVDGKLLFMRGGSLMIQPFDAGSLQLKGEPVPVARHVATSGAIGIFSVSGNGVLAYRTAETAEAPELIATWLDRNGKATGTAGEPGPLLQLALSPDGKRAAGRDAPAFSKGGDIWLLDLARGARTRLTFRRSPGWFPIWSPDGSRITFSSGDRLLDAIYDKAADGAGEERMLLQRPGEDLYPNSWTADGRFLLFAADSGSNKSLDLWVLPVKGDGKPVRLLGTAANELYGSFSPDGRWVAYVSEESGRNEVYIRPFVPSGPALGEGKWQVSRDGAYWDQSNSGLPRWRNGGKQILFQAGRSVMMAEVDASGAAPVLSTPKALFSLPNDAGWDVSSDGQHYLASLPTGQREAGSLPITVVLNWQSDLKQ